MNINLDIDNDKKCQNYPPPASLCNCIQFSLRYTKCMRSFRIEAFSAPAKIRSLEAIKPA